MRGTYPLKTTLTRRTGLHIAQHLVRQLQFIYTFIGSQGSLERLASTEIVLPLVGELRRWSDEIEDSEASGLKRETFHVDYHLVNCQYQSQLVVGKWISWRSLMAVWDEEERKCKWKRFEAIEVFGHVLGAGTSNRVPMSKHYLSAQTAFYSLNPDRDILGPLAINHAYIRLAQASGQSYHSSGRRL